MKEQRFFSGHTSALNLVSINYFASSDPHHGIQVIPSDILSGKSSGILFGILFEILSGILSGICSDILSGIPGILSVSIFLDPKASQEDTLLDLCLDAHDMRFTATS